MISLRSARHTTCTLAGMSRFLRFALATISAGVLASTTSGVARADQASAVAGAPAPPVCRVSLGGDGAGMIKLPANAPALLVTEVSNGGTRATVTADLFDTSTRIPLGATKTDANGLTILEIPSGTTGTYNVDLDADCGPSVESPKKDLQLVLDAAAVEIPKSVGTISLRPSAKPGPQQTFALDVSPGLRAFLPAAVIEMTVTGRPPVSLGKGNLGTNNTFTAQTGFVCVENGALHREKRTVSISVSAKIAGVAQLPTPASVDVTVDCGAIEWTSGTTGGTTTTPGDTTTTTPSGSTTTTTGGCAAAPSAPENTPAGTAFAAIALGAVVVLVRRRRS